MLQTEAHRKANSHSHRIEEAPAALSEHERVLAVTNIKEGLDPPCL